MVSGNDRDSFAIYRIVFLRNVRVASSKEIFLFSKEFARSFRQFVPSHFSFLKLLGSNSERSDDGKEKLRESVRISQHVISIDSSRGSRGSLSSCARGSRV